MTRILICLPRSFARRLQGGRPYRQRRDHTRRHRIHLLHMPEHEDVTIHVGRPIGPIAEMNKTAGGRHAPILAGGAEGYPAGMLASGSPI